MELIPIIGLEIHVELNTDSKLFCSCSTAEAQPNTHCCDICTGFPGSKPVLNKKVLEYALKLALALNCKIAPKLIFSRKTYFYPDMGKNYQITQYELPLGSKGSLQLSNKEINLTRIHIEEDPAALVHEATSCLVDYNRSGKPLCEIVTEPELSSPEEAREFIKKLITILNYLKIFNIKTGTIKADANISIRGFERTEIKNITGAKEIESALKYEIERQKALVEEGTPITTRETRGWDANKQITLFQRSKEEETDYGYIIDTDLVPIEIAQQQITDTRNELPELPDVKIYRYTNELKIKKEDAEVISADPELAYIFEHSIKKISPEKAAEWIRREVARVLNYSKKELDETFIKPHLTDLLELIGENKITRQTAQRLMELLTIQDINIKKYVQENNLGTVSDTEELEHICKEVLKHNESVVNDYKSGNEKSFNFLLGQVIRALKGKADPQIATEILKKLL